MALCLWSQSHFFLTSQTPALASNVSISHGLLWPWLLTRGGREGRTTADRPCSVCSSWEGLSPGSPSMTCQASVPLFPSGLVAPPLVTYRGLRVCLGREEQHTLQPSPPSSSHVLRTACMWTHLSESAPLLKGRKTHTEHPAHTRLC